MLVERASTRSSIPVGGAIEETARTRTSRAPKRGERRPQVGERPLGDLAEVGLRDHEHVGDLHDPGLQELEHVAGPGLDHDGDRVGDVRHLGLGLTDADGLDHDDIEGGRQCAGGRSRLRVREPAEPVAGGRGANEQRAIGRIDLEPGAVAEQCPARAARRRIDGEHRDRSAASAPGGDEPREQRGLADAGRSGDADDMRSRLATERRGRHGRQQSLGLRSRVARAAFDQIQGRGRGGQVPVAETGAELAAVNRCGAQADG